MKVDKAIVGVVNRCDEQREICIIHGCYQVFRDKEKTVSPFLTSSYHLTTASMLKYDDLVILVVTDRQTNKTDHFASCACTCGNYNLFHVHGNYNLFLHRWYVDGHLILQGSIHFFFCLGCGISYSHNIISRLVCSRQPVIYVGLSP